MINITLPNILPDSIAEDENVQAVAKAIDAPLQEISSEIKYCLLLSRIDEQPENIVNELAWHFHVDFYDYKLPLEKKRNLVKQSIIWHKKKGTPWAVEQIVQSVFQSAQLTEWFEYGGEPYHFKVKLIDEPLQDISQLNTLVDAMYSTKNTRSWCDEFNFRVQQSGNIYFQGYTEIYEIINIGQAAYEPKTVIGSVYWAGSTSIFEIINIGGQSNG